jgi:DNA-binding transcriptional LysR family regulator
MDGFSEIRVFTQVVELGGFTRAAAKLQLIPVVLADFVVGPALSAFMVRFPDVSIDLTVRDRVIDPIAEGVDVVVRLASAHDSELVARKLSPARSVLVAAPGYLAKRGRPRTLAELRDHEGIVYLTSSGPLAWRFRRAAGAGDTTFSPHARLHAGSGNVLTHAAVAGLGLAQTFEYHVTNEIADGKLEVVLAHLEPEPRVVQALFARQNADLPKVRVFVEFLVQVFSTKRAEASTALHSTRRKR